MCNVQCVIQFIILLTITMSKKNHNNKQSLLHKRYFKYINIHVINSLKRCLKYILKVNVKILPDIFKDFEASFILAVSNNFLIIIIIYSPAQFRIGLRGRYHQLNWSNIFDNFNCCKNKPIDIICLCSHAIV